MVFILFIFFIIAFLVTQSILVSGFISKEECILSFTATVLPGLFVSFVYASKKFARNYEEFTWGITAFLIISIVFGSLSYQLYLLNIGIAQPIFDLILNMFLFWLPLSLVTSFSVFEILSERKDKKPFSFHVKRLTGRICSAETYFLLVLGIFVTLYFLSVPLVSERHIITILVVANIIAFIPTYYIFIKNSKVKRFLSKLEN